MPAPTTLLSFALASFALAVTPGPSVVLLLAVGTEVGRRAAGLTALGLALGTLAWTAVVAAGLGALLTARPDLVDVVALAGACYLLWLAVRAVRDGRADHAHAQDDRDGRDGLARDGALDDPGHVVAGRSLVDGLVVNLLNPSLPVFLAALLPAFVDPARGTPWRQVLVLGAVLAAVSTVVNLGWGAVGAGVGRRLRAAAGRRRASAAVATTYGGLAVLALVSAVG